MQHFFAWDEQRLQLQHSLPSPSWFMLNMLEQAI